MSDRNEIMRNMGIRIGRGSLVDWNNLDGICPALMQVGENVIFATGARVCTHDAAPYLFTGKYRAAPVIIGDNVFIGYFSLIMPGVRIGNNVIIGAMSMVTTDIPDNSLAIGHPAKVVKTLDEYLSDLDEKQLVDAPYENKMPDEIKRADIVRLTDAIYQKHGLAI